MKTNEIFQCLKALMQAYFIAPRQLGVALPPALYTSANIQLLSFARFVFSTIYTGLAIFSGLNM